MNPDAEILIVIDPERYGGFYDVILEWIARELPEHRSWFTVQPLPFRIPDGARFALMVPWLQDPVEHRTPRVYEAVMALTDQCNDLGIPIVNRVENLVRIGKSIGSLIMGTTGIRTPNCSQIIHIESFLENFLGLTFPLFVREEFGHGGRMLRADTPEEARAIPFHKFTHPTAIEVIDLGDWGTGLFRKYRYLVAGDMGMPQHLQTSQSWITRGRFRVINEATQAEETEYFRTPCPHHNAFQEARKALGLDFLAFDYSLDAKGNPVVWEANPYPTLDIVKKDHRLDYLDESLHRAHAMLVALYFKTAGLAMPEKLEASLRDYPCVQGVRV